MGIGTLLSTSSTFLDDALPVIFMNFLQAALRTRFYVCDGRPYGGDHLVLYSLGGTGLSPPRINWERLRDGKRCDVVSCREFVDCEVGVGWCIVMMQIIIGGLHYRTNSGSWLLFPGVPPK